MSFQNESKKQYSKRSKVGVQKTNSDQFDLSPYTPQGIEVVLYDNSGGALHIPHRMMEWLIKVCANKVQLRVMLCLIRNTLGYQRSICEASQTFVGNWTDLLEPNARRALKQLLALGLIVQRHRGTSKDNWGVYEVPVVKAYLEFLWEKNGDTGSAPTGIETNSVEAPPSSKQAENPDQNNLSSQINLNSNKEVLKKLKETLSQKENSDLPEELSNYLSSLKAYKKREGEFNHFRELRKDYSLSDLSKCVEYLLGYGTPGKGAICHSPMAYLSHAMSEVLKAVRQSEAKTEKVVRHQKARETLVDQGREQKDAEEAEFDAKIAAFESAFPSPESQHEYLVKFSERYPSLSVTGPALRNLAIVEWSHKGKESGNEIEPKAPSPASFDLGSLFKSMPGVTHG